jgi:hypothetical protein
VRPFKGNTIYNLYVSCWAGRSLAAGADGIWLRSEQVVPGR